MIASFIRAIILPVLVALVLLPTTAQAKICVLQDGRGLRIGDIVYPMERLARYIAVIGERDLYNSRGTRLTDYRAILQQDRANLHNSGVADRFDDFVEDVDDYFTTLDRRKLLSTTQYYFDCWMSPEIVTRLQRDIESGQVAGLVSVTVYIAPRRGMVISISLAG